MVFSLTSIAETIERFIRTEFQVADNDPMFTRDAHLFEGGISKVVASGSAQPGG